MSVGQSAFQIQEQSYLEDASYGKRGIGEYSNHALLYPLFGRKDYSMSDLVGTNSRVPQCLSFIDFGQILDPIDCSHSISIIEKRWYHPFMVVVKLKKDGSLSGNPCLCIMLALLKKMLAVSCLLHFQGPAGLVDSNLAEWQYRI